MGTLLHMRMRDEGYAVYDDAGELVATVTVNATTTEDFELELQRWGTEPIRRLITQQEALGFFGHVRAEELVRDYYPNDVVELEGRDATPDRWPLARA